MNNFIKIRNTLINTEEIKYISKLNIVDVFNFKFNIFFKSGISGDYIQFKFGNTDQSTDQEKIAEFRKTLQEELNRLHDSLINNHVFNGDKYFFKNFLDN